jgi:uroporphyrin-III C-methyltransferase/precorrin-2 dehydrogenase/sirohydrochlorin ferrochelatase
MPRKTLGEFVRAALTKGLDPATPAVAIASATLSDEAHVAATVAELEPLAAELPAGAPATIIIGWVARELAGSSAAILPFAKAAS